MAKIITLTDPKTGDIMSPVVSLDNIVDANNIPITDTAVIGISTVAAPALDLGLVTIDAVSIEGSTYNSMLSDLETTTDNNVKNLASSVGDSGTVTKLVGVGQTVSKFDIVNIVNDTIQKPTVDTVLGNEQTLTGIVSNGIRCFQISDTTVALFYSNIPSSSTYYLYAAVGTINGTTLTLGTPLSLSGSQLYPSIIDIDLIDISADGSAHFAATFFYYSVYYDCINIAANGTITHRGSATTWSSDHTMQYSDIIATSSDTIFNICNNSKYICVYRINLIRTGYNITGSTITGTGSIGNGTTLSPKNISCERVDNTSIVIAYGVTEDSINSSKLAVFTMVGLSPTLVTTAAFSTTLSILNPTSMQYIDNNHYLISYIDAVSGIGYVTSCIATQNNIIIGNTITFCQTPVTTSYVASVIGNKTLLLCYTDSTTSLNCTKAYTLNGMDIVLVASYNYAKSTNDNGAKCACAFNAPGILNFHATSTGTSAGSGNIIYRLSTLGGDNSYEGIALENGNEGEYVDVAVAGNVECEGAVNGQHIESYRMKHSTKAYCYYDNFISLQSYWDT